MPRFRFDTLLTAYYSLGHYYTPAHSLTYLEHPALVCGDRNVGGVDGVPGGDHGGVEREEHEKRDGGGQRHRHLRRLARA